MPYLLDGSAASFIPMRQQWQDVTLAKNARGATRYHPNKTVLLDFDRCTLAQYKQWEDFVTGASVASMTILGPDNLTFTAYSGVFLDFDQRPQVQNGLATGFTIRIREVTA